MKKLLRQDQKVDWVLKMRTKKVLAHRNDEDDSSNNDEDETIPAAATRISPLLPSRGNQGEVVTGT
jgi:hypothetical protein